MVPLNWFSTLPPLPSRPTLPARYRDAGLFVLLAVLFGGSFVAIKTGLSELPPVLFASLRFDVAAGALLAYVIFTQPRSQWLPRTRGDLSWIGVAAVLLIGLSNGLLFLGQGSTTPAAASVMYGLNPVLAPVFAWWLLGDRLSRIGAVGIAIALSGVILIVQPTPSTFTDAGALGQVLVLGAAIAIALGSVLIQRTDPQLGTMSLTAWAMAAGAVGLHVASLGLGESPAGIVDIGAATLGSLLFLAIPSTAVAYVIYFGLIDRVGPVRANLVAYTAPIFAALLGWFLLSAVVSSLTVLGFIVVVAGFGLIERETIRTELRRLRTNNSSTESTPKEGSSTESTSSASPPCDD